MDLSSLYGSVLATFRSMPVAALPSYAPIELAIAGYVLSGDGIGRRVLSAMSRYGGSLFGVTSGHQILAELPGVDRLLAQSHQIFTSNPAQYSLCTLVFGSVDSLDLQKKFDKSVKDLVPPLERTFLNDAASTAAVEKSRVAERAASLVSFSSDDEHMARWELSASIKVIQPETPGSPGKVEVNMQSLLRDFGACMSIPIIYGQDLLDRNPQLLDDFWVFDNDLFPLLMVGVPSWAPFKMMQDGLKARARIIDSLEGVFRRVEQERKGEPIDFGADISDISTMLRERNSIYTRDGWTFPERAAADLGTFWGLNANAQPVLFCLSKGDRPEILSMDFPSLFRKCQLFKACIFETYRLVNEPTSIRYVAQPVSVNDGNLKHDLNQGTYISVPLALRNKDPLIYEDPDTFVPDRFLETDPDTGKATAKYGKLKPWGTGAAMCKGRTFAEKEIISLGSAVLSLWDISPIDGKWKLPAMIPGTGVKKPFKDIRVVIQRRVLGNAENNLVL
ncbi:hypothetical protein ACHAPA_002159 [Fusarium lateritium]